MALVVLAEVAQRGLHRLAGALTQTAERGMGDRVGEILEKLDILFASLVADDALESFQHALRTLAAGDALAAGFLLREFHEEAGDLRHAGVLVHDDETAGAHDRADVLE